MAGAIRFRLEGLQRIQKLLRSPDRELWADDYRQMLEESAANVVSAMRPHMPRGATGRLAARLQFRVQKRPIPRWAVVKTTATRSSARYRRYSYPRRLEFDPKSRHANFYLTAFKRSAGSVQAAVTAFARKVERRWGG